MLALVFDFIIYIYKVCIYKMIVVYILFITGSVGGVCWTPLTLPLETGVFCMVFEVFVADFATLAVFGFVGGLFCGWLSWWRTNSAIDNINKRLSSKMGVAAKDDNEQEMVLAISEAAEMHANGATIPEIIKNIGMKHPAVAMHFVKQFLAGKLKLPGGL
jgi:hypothetical protein